MALFIAAMMSLSFSQEAITLRFQPREGDVLEITEKTALNLKASSKATEYEIVHRTVDARKEKIERVEGRRILRKVVEVSEDVAVWKDPMTGQYHRKEGALHGKKLTLVLRDGKMDTEGTASLPPESRNRMHLDSPHALFFPDGPVRVGHTWTISGDALKAAMHGEPFDGAVHLTFKEIKLIDGHRCAVIATRYDLRKKGGDKQPDVEMKLRGDWIVRIDRGTVLSLNVAGSAKYTGGEDPTYLAEGTYSAELSAKVLEASK
ncbi:MAG: hypothetical protein HY716_05095 [Planctomycetes bacterium]|nr:hypothetical protein [Planctomycetota bacterium]